MSPRLNATLRVRGDELLEPLGQHLAGLIDVIAAWGPHPVAYSALAGALIALSSGLGGLFDEGSHRWSTGLQLLALAIWCVGLVAPSAGWLAL